MTISTVTQACFIWALIFIAFGFLFRFYVPWSSGQFDLFKRLNAFREWLAVKYGWLAKLDYELAGLCVIVGLARLLILHT